MKVYIVTSGKYSDFRIDKVFTDKDKAEDFAKRASTDYYNTDYVVEEYDTEDDADLSLLPFTVSFHAWSGWVVRYDEYEKKACERNQFRYWAEIAKATPDEKDVIRIEDKVYRFDRKDPTKTLARENIVYRPEYIMMNLMAKDPQSALKIAHERYGMIKAMGNVFDEDKEYSFPSYKEINPRDDD